MAVQSEYYAPITTESRNRERLTDQKAEYEKRELELKKKDTLIAELLTRLGEEYIAR